MNYREIPYNVWVNRNKAKHPRISNISDMTIKDIERFCSHVNRTDKCWNFESQTKDKWARFDSKKLAHRVAYELFIGPIPYGLTIDHLCRNTRCVNPKHLEPATAEINTQRWVDYQRYGVTAVPEYAI